MRSEGQGSARSQKGGNIARLTTWKRFRLHAPSSPFRYENATPTRLSPHYYVLQIQTLSEPISRIYEGGYFGVDVVQAGPKTAGGESHCTITAGGVCLLLLRYLRVVFRTRTHSQ